jgi:PilZ domain-containing protein
MADTSTKKAQSEAFLKKMERLRLNKLCNRSIDLRGKVAGECQAYSFGDKTHYLDDRGYLLAKQLLDRFNGRYTFGVYETVLKAIKSLAPAPTEATTIQPKPILSRDKLNVQAIPFDYQLQRKEPRINFSTPVDLHLADVKYHAATIDITSSAIRIALKRASTLEQDDIVSVSFPELPVGTQTGLLHKVPYKIIKISNDELRSYIILARDRKDNAQVTDWFNDWTSKHNSPEHLDLESELFNLACHYYLRLYCQKLNNALFWLGDNEDPELIKASHMTTMAADSLHVLRNNEGNLELDILPIRQVLNEDTDTILMLSRQANKLVSYMAKRNDQESLALLLQWHSQQEQSQLLLLHVNKLHINSQEFEQEIAAIAEIDTQHAEIFKQRLFSLRSLLTVSNITTSCMQLSQPKKVDEPDANQTATSEALNEPKPTSLQHHTVRDDQRFFIRTDVNLFVNSKKYTVITNDVSESGLSLSLPGNVDLKIGTRVKLEFLRWQKLTKKVQLNSVPFIIRNKHFWSSETHLGLQRDHRACSSSLNKFFASVIELNKGKLAEDNLNVHISQESKVYASLLTTHIDTIPIYLGLDNDNKRIIQAVATSETNSARDKTDLWLALQDAVTDISEQIKTLADKDTPDNPVSFGLYCYQQNKATWKISIESSFANAAEKALFINRALLCEQHYFFHCTLSALSTNAVASEDDLHQQIMQLRSHSQHKVKQIREVLQSLFAIGELTDITDIVAAAYK